MDGWMDGWICGWVGGWAESERLKKSNRTLQNLHNDQVHDLYLR
jgi:hypothetical protein